MEGETSKDEVASEGIWMTQESEQESSDLPFPFYDLSMPVGLGE